MTHSLRKCPDCSVSPGELHLANCDVERCPDCGGQAFSCGCPYPFQHPPIPWSGEWPGLENCRRLGWLRPDGSADLNRLYAEGIWDPVRQQWDPERS